MHVKVFTAEESIAICGFNFKNTIANFEDGHVKCTAAEVINSNCFAVFLVHTISERRRSRLVDDAEDFEASNLTRVFRGLALRVIKVSWHCDNGLGNVRAKESFRCFFHFCQNHRRNF